LCLLFTDNPLLNEPGLHSEKHIHECKAYRDIIVYKNYSVAMLDIMCKNTQAYPPDFDIFYSFAKKHFMDNVDKYIGKITQKIADVEDSENIRVVSRIYGMSILINYNKLLQRCNIVKDKIDNNII
jgi:hypothetical protein